MEFRKLGSSDLQVSAFALGSWLTYEFMAEDDALTVFRSGLDQGINFLDDARYDDRTGEAPLKSGYSEVLFGRLLQRSGSNRHDLIIGNKLWLEFYPGQSLKKKLTVRWAECSWTISIWPTAPRHHPASNSKTWCASLTLS